MEKIINALYNATINDDPETIKAIIAGTIADIADQFPFRPVVDLRDNTLQNLGYMCGYLPVEVGNEALRKFDLYHPVFGQRMPTEMDAALAAGMELGKKHAEAQLAKEEAARKAQAAADGIDMPDVEEPVDSERAKAILKALKAEKDKEKAVKSKIDLSIATYEVDEDDLVNKMKGDW